MADACSEHPEPGVGSLKSSEFAISSPLAYCRHPFSQSRAVDVGLRASAAQRRTRRALPDRLDAALGVRRPARRAPPTSGWCRLPRWPPRRACASARLHHRFKGKRALAAAGAARRSSRLKICAASPPTRPAARRWLTRAFSSTNGATPTCRSCRWPPISTPCSSAPTPRS